MRADEAGIKSSEQEANIHCGRGFEAAVKNHAGGQVVLMNIQPGVDSSLLPNKPPVCLCHLPESDRLFY